MLSDITNANIGEIFLCSKEKEVALAQKLGRFVLAQKM